jgi:glycosyltransferase involved in cell wall biosynthesis
MQLLHQLGCSPQEQIILFLGTLEPRKNPLFLLDVLKELLAANANVKLIMCGTGPLWGAIGRRIAQLGLQNHVLLPGIIPEELMPDYYNIADVFVFPSSLEGFGFVMGEAMSCGKPVVALNTSAMPEVVEDGVTGFLASPHDNADFVRKTLLLLDHEELRLRMGVQARERIERLFRWERAAKETLNIYQQTIEQFHWGPLRDSARARARE